MSTQGDDSTSSSEPLLPNKSASSHSIQQNTITPLHDTSDSSKTPTTWKAHKYVKLIFVLVTSRSFAQSLTSIVAMYFRDWLGVSTAMASAFTNVTLAVSYGSGLLGGALADTFLGHFRVISIGCISAIVSMLVLFATSALYCWYISYTE